MVSITHALQRIKDNLPAHLNAQQIHQACHDVGHRWRQRLLDPATTIYLFIVQVLHCNTACSHLPHLVGRSFSASAYSQARKRLPLAVFQKLFEVLVASVPSVTQSIGLWRGHRTWVVDASNCLMPDTPALEAHFGRPGNHKEGGGYPMAHLLMLFDAATGLIVSLIPSKCRTGDTTHLHKMYPHLQPNDLLIGDRAFGLYTHLALILKHKTHGLFRLHQTINVNFTPHRPYRHPLKPSITYKHWPRSRWVRRLGKDDQIVKYYKPRRRSVVIDASTFDALPDAIVVRELRYTITRSGFRTKQITLVTTLLDPVRYPKEALADLYGSRWQVETNIRHLKTTMGMKQLKCKNINSVMKELMIFVLVYNLVRLVMLESAKQQRVHPDRISFVDALRWLCCDRTPLAVADLLVNLSRPGRVEPRQLKRGPKNYGWMKKPRHVLQQELMDKTLAA